MLVFWVPVLLLIAWVMTQVTKATGTHGENAVPSPSTRGLLDRRYATVELGREQYLQMVRDRGYAPSAATSTG